MIKLRCATVAIGLAIPLGGCLETLGHPPYNHGPTATHLGLCHLTDGPDTGARCELPPPPPRSGFSLGWFWW
jgi:hypothetical protein